MKKLGYGILVIVALAILAPIGLGYWIESELEEIINTNPDRSYDITFEDIKVRTFLKGVQINDLGIVPLKMGSGTMIEGQVEKAVIEDFEWGQFLFQKQLKLEEITFVKPVFNITLSSDTTSKTSGKGIQLLFQDLLSRIDLENFLIEDGKIVLLEPSQMDTIGSFRSLNIMATGLETDSVLLKHLVPFHMNELKVSLQNIELKLDDNTKLNLGQMNYSLMDETIRLNQLSIGFLKPWIEVSHDIAIMKDLMELDLEEMTISNLAHSASFYSDLDLKAGLIDVTGLDLRFHKNKNYPRPADFEKPMFNQLIGSIPIKLEVDSIQIQNSKILYEEIGENKSSSGTIYFDQIEGSIIGVSNVVKERSADEYIVANLQTYMLGEGKVNCLLKIPYGQNAFEINVDVGPMKFEYLNQTLEPLVGIEITSGDLRGASFTMNATRLHSYNSLILDYSDLSIDVVKEKEDHKLKHMRLFSALANTAIRTNNLPEQKRYRTATYESDRNIYRAPIVFLVQSFVKGASEIVPGKNVRKMMKKHEKKKKSV